MLKSPFTVFPESSAKTAWDCVGFIFIIIQSIEIPFHLCFNTVSEGFMVVINNIIDIFFMVDVCKP
jgi:hypothetical protein